MENIKRIGLLAGGGELPVILADKARIKGAKVIAFAAEDIASRELENHVDKIYWIKLTDTGKLPFLFLTNRVRNLVMVGKIEKSIFFKNDFSESKEISTLLKDTKNRADDTMLRKVSKLADKFGVRFIDPMLFLSDILPGKGTFTKREPTAHEWQDIEFGIKIARSLGKLDIGQTVVVQNKAILAVEAIEGTDKAIKRAGGFSGGGAVVVKTLKPGQDTRFDIPAVGPETISSLIESKASVLAIEAGKTFFIKQDECVKKADQCGISIVAV